MKKRILLPGALFSAALVFALPVVIIICASFMGAGELAAVFRAGAPLRLIPYEVTPEGYFGLLFKSQTYMATFWNSMLIALAVTLGNTLVSLTAAFVLIKARLSILKPLLFLYIVAALMPFQVTLLPNYILIRQLGLYNTWGALILPGVFAPFGVFLLHQFLKGMPEEWVEAALMETSSLTRVLIGIAAPAMKPGLIAVMVLSFSEAWNMVEQPLVLLKDDWRYPLSLALNSLKDGGLHILFPGAVLFMAPTVLLYFLFEDELVTGLHAMRL